MKSFLQKDPCRLLWTVREQNTVSCVGQSDLEYRGLIGDALKKDFAQPGDPVVQMFNNLFVQLYISLSFRWPSI